MVRRSVLFVLVLVVTALLPARTSAQPGRGCFDNVPGITNCISDVFLDYYAQNGGLIAFGYPITPIQSEYNPDTGQSYPTQWFERNRFELHVENKPPFNILLGRLGDQRLRQIGRDWRAEGREPGPLQGCIWFEETGHNVCNQGYFPGQVPFGFRGMWEIGGGGPNCGLLHGEDRGSCGQAALRFLGLPLTRAVRERNLSGDLVITQWFERARLEWHGTSGGLGDVEFGLLGSELQGLFGHD